MPAYNAQRTIRDTYFEIPKYLRNHIILVDDGSKDKTVSVSKKLGITVFAHSTNLGYGGNQKTCYWEALKLKPDVVVMLHPDYQYDATMIEELIAPILKDRYDFMFGSRIANKKTALAGGMPKIKYYVNRIVCLIQNILLGTNFTEQFSGFRAFSAKLLTTVPFGRFSNDFVFDQEMTISSINHGFRIGEIAIPTRYHQKASSIAFVKGTKFILEGFWLIFRLYLHEMGIVSDRRLRKRGSDNKSLTAQLAMVAVVGIFDLFLYRVLEVSLTLGILLIIQTLLLAVVLIKGTSFNKSMLYLVMAVSVVYLFLIGFNRQLFSLSRLEQNTLFDRQQYIGGELGRIYGNRFGLYYFNQAKPAIHKYTQNLFAPLDFLTVFNLGSLLSLMTTPFVLLGSLVFLKNMKTSLVIYPAVVFFIAGYLQHDPKYYLFIYLPLISIFTYLGLRETKIILSKLKLK